MPETKIIAFANSKGGCGKSSFAINLALSLMAKKKNVVRVFDLDQQAATEGFLIDYEMKVLPNLEHKMIPHRSLAQLPGMIDGLKGVASHVIIDIGGGDLLSIQSILPHITTMIIPTRPSRKDYFSTESFIVALTDKGYFDAFPDMKTFIVLNQCSYHHQSTVAQETADEFNSLITEGGLQGRVEVLNSRITISTAWIEADINTTSISETKSKSAKQWEALLKELAKKGGI